MEMLSTDALRRATMFAALEIEGFTLIKDIPYDPVRKCYLIVGLVGQKEAPKIGSDIDKIERIY